MVSVRLDARSLMYCHFQFFSQYPKITSLTLFDLEGQIISQVAQYKRKKMLQPIGTFSDIYLLPVRSFHNVIKSVTQYIYYIASDSLYQDEMKSMNIKGLLIKIYTQ